ncbi:MAG: hypothetical protein LUH02_03505, partial [Erysipelotrichaceae bacterium]|nr:hypothetical protein [Erysipelotrichaceae bacterium]
MTKYILTICLYIEKGFDDEGIYKFVGNKYFDKVQIIIVDSYNNGKISDFASKYENMIYLNSDNSDISYCYNMCKDYIEGEYINYTSNIYSFCQSSLDNIIDYLLKNDKLVVCTRLTTIEKEEKIHLKKHMRTMEYILSEKFLPFPLTISIFFVKKSIVDGIKFNDFYNKYSPIFFLFDLYKKISVIDYLLDAYVLSRV